MSTHYKDLIDSNQYITSLHGYHHPVILFFSFLYGKNDFIPYSANIISPNYKHLVEPKQSTDVNLFPRTMHSKHTTNTIWFIPGPFRLLRHESTTPTMEY